MGIDEQFTEFKRLLLCLQQEITEARSEIRSLRFGDRISFSLQQAAEITGIDYNTLHKRCKTGLLPYTQTERGGAILIKRTDLEAFLDRYKVSNNESEPEFQIKLSHSSKRVTRN